jgi:tetratricopeptide (TPR) repeat protein
MEQTRPSGSAGESPWTVPRPLAAVLIAAALFRAVYFYLYARRSLFFDAMLLDSDVYDRWGRAIAGGEWVGKEAFYFPPLYPYLLGTLDAIAGPSYALVYLLQALLGLLNIVLTFRAGTRLFGKRSGLLAAAGAALYAPFAFFETKILGTTLGLTLNLAALLLLIRAERRSTEAGSVATGAFFAAGVAIGGAALCLPATVLLAALYTLRLARRSLRGGAAILGGTALMLVPVLAHNLVVAGDPLFLSAQGGITFYQGNNRGAAGLYAPAPGFSGAPEAQAAEEKSIAEREAGRPLRRSQISAYFFRKGLAWIAASPGDWLWLEARKLAALAGDYEASTEYSLYLERSQIPWLRLMALPYAVIAGLGIAGLWFCRRARQSGRSATRSPGWDPHAALRLYALYAAGVPLLFYVSSRYRLPLVPALLIYAGAFIDRAPAALRAADRQRTAWTSALVGATAIALVSFFLLATPSESAEANVDYNIGNLLSARHQPQEALDAYDRSLARWPTNVMALVNRGNVLDALGRTDEALASYRRAEVIDPRFWTAVKNQGVVLYRLQRYDEAADAYRRGLASGGSEARFLLGVTLQKLGRTDEAVATLEEAVRLNPRESRAHSRLGEIYEGRGDIDTARSHFRQALAANPADPVARKALARLGG